MDKVERIEIRLLRDDRGWVAWPVAEIDLQHLGLSRFHVPCLKPGAVRGNHYHQNSIEFAFILSGPCRALFEDNETGEQQEVMVEGIAPVLFKIAPRVTHAFKNEASMTYSFCAMSSKQTASTKRISAEKPFSECRNPLSRSF